MKKNEPNDKSAIDIEQAINYVRSASAALESEVDDLRKANGELRDGLRYTLSMIPHDEHSHSSNWAAKRCKECRRLRKLRTL